MQTNPERRRFLKKAALGASLVIGGPGVLAAEALSPDRTTLQAAAARTIVFQGDSITDAGRNKEHQQANQSWSLGSGYVALIAAELLGKYPKHGWQCYNRGISGHKVHQLAHRWQADCLDLQPDVLSILIGVNDFWHTLTHDYKGTVEVYEKDLRTLLDRTKAALPEVKLILGEPFVVDGGTAITDPWHPTFDAYQAAARAIADDYGAVWIPYQQVFNDALKEAPVSYWCPDGVHPSPAGNYLMAQAWLQALHTALNG